MMSHISVEQASFHAWPAFKQIEKEGWVLRFTEGYTKRANSVTVLSAGPKPYEQRVIECESAYNDQNLPCIFRLLSFNDNTRTESILDSRGYYKGDHSLVLTEEIRGLKFSPAILDPLNVDDWMAHYCDLNQKDKADHVTHMEMINRIEDDLLLVAFQKRSQVVSCGLGVIHQGFFGIFDIVTDPVYRNKGFGKELIEGMLHWAVNKNAHTAYVQVVADNDPAIRLYSNLGYEPAYEYHYKIQNYKPSSR